MTNDIQTSQGNHVSGSVAWRSGGNRQRGGENSRRSLSGSEVDFRGRFLTITPGDELVFEKKEGEREQGRDSSDTIQLTNTTHGFVAFKVKTTAPEKFRVKPSFGCIEPGQSAVVEVSIQQGFLLTAQRDKFLVMSTSLENPPKNSNDLVEFWHDILKDEAGDEVEEHRLRCSVVTQPAATLDQLDAGDVRSGQLSSPHIPSSLLDKLENIDTKVDRLIALHQLERDAPLLTKQWNLIAAAIFFLIVYVGVYLVQALFGR